MMKEDSEKNISLSHKGPQFFQFNYAEMQAKKINHIGYSLWATVYLCMYLHVPTNTLYKV